MKCNDSNVHMGVFWVSLIRDLALSLCEIRALLYTSPKSCLFFNCV
jgi:hypothetical protein